MLGCMLREGSCSGKEKDILYVLGLSHPHYGLTGLYVIGKRHLKAALSEERRNHGRK